MACFDNKDYKKIRVDSDDFLRESNPKDQELMKVRVPNCFESTNFSMVIRKNSGITECIEQKSKA